LEVTDETDRDATGDPEDAIYEGLWKMDREKIDARAGGRDLWGK
jgi:hypothetical protein